MPKVLKKHKTIDKDEDNSSQEDKHEKGKKQLISPLWNDHLLEFPIVTVVYIVVKSSTK